MVQLKFGHRWMIPYKAMDVITYPCPNLSQSLLVIQDPHNEKCTSGGTNCGFDFGSKHCNDVTMNDVIMHHRSANVRSTVVLIHWGLMTSYGVRKFVLHCFRQWLDVWWHYLNQWCLMIFCLFCLFFSVITHNRRPLTYSLAYMSESLP